MANKILLQNRYFPWQQCTFDQSKIYYKGHAFINNTLAALGQISQQLISDIESGDNERIKGFLSKLNGTFCIVIETPSHIFATVDFLRSIPLFYATSNQEFHLSDDANVLRNLLNSSINELNATEFLLSGYVTGPRTLCDNIKQLETGQYLIYEKQMKKLHTIFFFRFYHHDFFRESEDELIQRLDNVIIDVFKRLIQSTIDKGKKIVVPLSGGLDSRIIVTMLKRLGVKEVLCYTYGRKNDVNVKISRQVAESLGYSWKFVKYSHKMLYDVYHSEGMREFQKYAGNLTSLPHNQDFFAVREMKQQGMLSRDSVLVPGHSGDMLTGSDHSYSYFKNGDYILDAVSIHILKGLYSLCKFSNEDLHDFLIKQIKDSLGSLEVYDNETAADAIEMFDFNNRQAKFLINSVRSYEFFGFGWRIPWWDFCLIDFFLKVPLKYRIGQSLYIKYARSLFDKNFPFLNSIECTTFSGERLCSPLYRGKPIKNYIFKSPLYGSLFIFPILQSTFYPKPSKYLKSNKKFNFIILPSLNLLHNKSYLDLVL